MKRTYFAVVIVATAVLFSVAACGSPEQDGAAGQAVEVVAPAETAETSIPESSQPSPPFRVIAYVTTSVVPEVIPYERITHLNYSFLIPNADGSFEALPNAWKLQKIVQDAHEQDVKVLISVGGWGWDEQFETLAADPETRGAFVTNLSAFLDEYDLDGADVDWEYPDPGQSALNYLALMRELRAAMPDKLLTTAVVNAGENGDGVPDDTFPLFDFINIMSYDGAGHGSMEQFMDGLEYWQGRGLPPEKTVMGVPFYARPSELPYRKIVESDPQAAFVDQIERYGETIAYNGIPTIQAKTTLAQERAGGIMFWTLEHDALDEHSLLRAIDETIHSNNGE